nr:hypothetical protein [Tanacetum cinerariifolium]
MVNVIPLDHVDNVHVVEPNQHDNVLVVLEPILEAEDKDPEKEEFEEEEDDPQEEEDDMEVDIEEDESKQELTYPYEEVDPLNPPPPASESEPKDVIKESNDLLPGLMRRDINSLFGRMDSLLRRLCSHETAHALVEKKDKAKDEYYGKLILDLGNEVRSGVKQGTTTMEKLFKKLGSAEDKVEYKKLMKELEEARFSNTFLRMKNEQVEIDLYWTRVQAHEIMPPKTAPLIQAAIRRMIKESVDAVIAAERARQANAINDARGSRPVRGQDAALAVREFTFARFMKCNLTAFHGTEGAVELRRWFKKTESVLGSVNVQRERRVSYNRRSLKNGARTLELEGLTDNTKGEVTSSKPANLNEANNQKQGKARAMVTAPTNGKVSSGSLPLYECCFNFHVGLCTIKSHKCGKVGHKARYCKEKNVARVKKEEVREVLGRAYAIKDVEPKGLNVVTVKKRASHEVELADGRVVSTNTVLKGST